MVEDNVKAQMRKGILDYCILAILSQGDSYAPKIIAELKEAEMIVVEGTLYPILYRLEDDGMIRSQWSTGEGRTAPKKIYEATDAGQAENLRRQRVWREFDDTVNAFLQGGRES